MTFYVDEKIESFPFIYIEIKLRHLVTKLYAKIRLQRYLYFYNNKKIS